MPRLTARLAYVFALSLAFALPGLEWLQAVDIGRLTARAAELPPGQHFYLAAKLLGMLAMSLALVQVAFSVFGRLGQLRLPRADHKVLGAAIAALIVLHACAFVTAVSLRNGHATLHLFLPDMLNGSYNRGLGIGVFGFWLVLAGTLLPAVWRRLPRLVHRLAPLAVSLGLVHALWIGSEKTYLWTLLALFVAVGLTAAVLRLSARRGARARQ